MTKKNNMRCFDSLKNKDIQVDCDGNTVDACNRMSKSASRGATAHFSEAGLAKSSKHKPCEGDSSLLDDENS